MLAVYRPFNSRNGTHSLGGADGLFHGHIDGVELVVTGDLFERGGAAILLEDDEIADQIQKTALFKHTLEEHFKLGDRRRRDCLALDRLPGQEPFLIRRSASHAGIQPIGDDQQFVGNEQGGDLLFVGLKLVECGPDGGFFIGGVFELDHRQGQAH